MNVPDLQVERLAKSYPTPGEPLQVLREVTFALRRGESLAIVGPSGSGKSTLLNILGALDPPSSGSYQLAGVDPYRLAESAQAQFRNQQIGFVFQDHHLLPQLTVLENVLVPTLASGKPSGGAIERAKELLGRVGLSDRLGHLPGELSGGQKERVAVARALILGPTLVLADEPTGNLDRHNAEQISTLLRELQREQNTILIVVTHSNSLAEQMDRQVELIDGQIRNTGS